STLRDRFGNPLFVLMIVVGVLLAIACINMASMMLARAASRQREMAVRVGLGASRLRLVQQTMMEALLLSLTGALAGVVLAHWATAALLRIMASGRQHERVAMDIQPDMQTLLFTAGIAVLTGLVFGLAPACYAFRTAPASPLRPTGAAGQTRWGRAFGSGLVVAQVAASVVLLGAAGLFVSYLSKLRNFDLGFQRDNILLMRVEPEQGMDRAVRALRYKELLQRLAAIPGVRSVSSSGATPIQGAGASRMVIAEGFTERPEDRRYVSVNWVAPKYFETMGTPLLQGRDFQFEDEGRAPVMIVNQALVDYYFKGVNPIGKHLRMDSNNDKGEFEIIGVVANAKYTELREAPPRTMYRNTFQQGFLASQFIVRTHVPPESIVSAVRRPVMELLPGARIDGLLTMADQIDGAIVPERLIAQLTGLFGALGALIAAIGLYGLLAYSVARRTSEIGIRMALGAAPADVYRAVLRQALTITAVGLLIGSVLAYWGEGLAAAMIADLPLEHHLPLMFGAAVTVALALLAAFVPARRASRIDPVQALRGE
ncbi:MAG: FtsX-like permease family protein, partial [Acidobacteriota bacterium]